MAANEITSPFTYKVGLHRVRLLIELQLLCLLELEVHGCEGPSTATISERLEGTRLRLMLWHLLLMLMLMLILILSLIVLVIITSHLLSSQHGDHLAHLFHLSAETLGLMHESPFVLLQRCELIPGLLELSSRSSLGWSLGQRLSCSALAV